jgi:hypothetical protein
VSDENPRFTIRASASRLNKGLLAVPQKHKTLFPTERASIQVAFDDESETREVTFHPYDPVTKEARILGLGNWFKTRGVREGDKISIVLEDPERWRYRLVLDRYLLQQQETQARQQLEDALTDSEAQQQLEKLVRLARRRSRDVAGEELLRLAHESQREARPIIAAPVSERHEGVPSGIRILLRELHDGKCQICSFTFEKRNGEPFFEIHHLDPKVGHHPTNLLVVCPNCHAQLEHATVTDLRWAGAWLVAVRINGKRFSVRQPLAHDALKRGLFLLLIMAAAQISRIAFRKSTRGY